MRVDAHQHFWNLEKVSYPWLGPDYGVIYRNIEAPELEPQLKKAGIDKTVVVQAMDSFEDTNYMLETARNYSWIGGVVGWVPLDRPDEVGPRLDSYVKNPLFKGVRHLIHENPDPDWILRPNVIEGLKVLASFGLPFDLVAVFPNHLKHVPTLVEKVPDLKIVIDHLAKPPIKDGVMEPWASQFAAASSYPQVYTKVSGLNTAADWESWSAQDLQPYVEFAMKCFGSTRLMFGSDWPVATLAGDYQTVWEETNKVLTVFSESEKEDLLGNTATDFYNLDKQK